MNRPQQTDQVLTTAQMLMALEEMPPHTAYGTIIHEMNSAETAILMTARCTREEAGEYLLMIVPDFDAEFTGDEILTMIVRFPDRESFLERIAAAPYVAVPTIWMPDPTGWAQSMLADS